jgi:hypothetical protein
MVRVVAHQEVKSEYREFSTKNKTLGERYLYWSQHLKLIIVNRSFIYSALGRYLTDACLASIVHMDCILLESFDLSSIE